MRQWTVPANNPRWRGDPCSRGKRHRPLDGSRIVQRALLNGVAASAQRYVILDCSYPPNCLLSVMFWFSQLTHGCARASSHHCINNQFEQEQNLVGMKCACGCVCVFMCLCACMCTLMFFFVLSVCMLVCVLSASYVFVSFALSFCCSPKKNISASPSQASRQDMAIL